jgi:hypothetical protein
MATDMPQTTSDIVTPRAWVATGLLAAAVAVGLVLFFLLGDDVRPILTTVTPPTS